MDERHIMLEFNRVARSQGWSHYHSSENLLQALAVEVGELMQAMSKKDHCEDVVAAELADVQMYLLALADSLSIDMAKAVADKQSYNRRRFKSFNSNSIE